MSQLKGVIFGWDNVLVANGSLKPQKDTLDRIGELVRFLADKGIEIVVLTNGSPVITDTRTGETTKAKSFFEKVWKVKLDWHQFGYQVGKPGKQSHEGFAQVLEAKKWKPNNAIYVGNSTSDMQAAVNNKLLLLNAKWYPDTSDTTDYGFHVAEPEQAARFIDVFCIRSNYWYYQINDGQTHVYTLAPLGSYFAESKYYSDDFLANVKNEQALDDEYWAKFLSTSLYFSGVYHSIDYITAYPKHRKNSYPTILVKPMDTFAKCFNKRYIPDLIQRHTDAVKSQFNRATVDHQNQLDTICLRQVPSRIVKGALKPYSKFPIEEGKTVLVIDDVCTKGMSFEASRHYLNAYGIKVVNVAFLKARNHAYESIRSVSLPYGVFGKNKVTDLKLGKTYGYNEHIVDMKTIAELTDRLKRYQDWDWPAS